LVELTLDVVRSAVVCLGLMMGMAYMTWFERRAISKLQVRVGPNRAGVAGLLQPLADAMKLLFKEDIVPMTADKLLYPLAPALALFAALAAFAVIPLGPTVDIGGVQIPIQIAELPVSLLYIVAVSSLGVYGLILGGWSSGSKYSLLGGLRAAAQVVSYELVLGMALVGVALVAGSLSLGEIVAAQARSVPFALLQPLGFLLYYVAAIAEVNRAPFDLPEADTELVAGYHTEYSGFRFGMFYIAEYINMITVSALAATLFMGGWVGPFLPGPHWIAVKMLFFLFLFVWLRATLPRLRYDQLMRLSWGVLVPLSLLNLAITAVAVVALG
jgi:NADH-quinone oxidoreductase subunit H